MGGVTSSYCKLVKQVGVSKELRDFSKNHSPPNGHWQAKDWKQPTDERGKRKLAQIVPSNRCQLADHDSIGYKTAMKESAACRAPTEIW